MLTFGFLLGPLFFGLIGAALLEHRGYFRASGAIAMIALLATAGFLAATVLFQTFADTGPWEVASYLYGAAVVLSLLVATVAVAGVQSLLFQPLFLVAGLIYLGMAAADPPLRPAELA